MAITIISSWPDGHKVQIRDAQGTRWVDDSDPILRGASIEQSKSKRCRDCGAYGPVDGAGNGYNCGCASE